MCGIVAQYSPEQPLAPEPLRAALATLGHRGPDGQRHWFDPRKRVGLGHARLSIVDLINGDQPLVNEDGSIRAVVNGELYEHARLRAELEAQGHVFKTRSDSEVLIHLYEQYGAQCVHHLRGEVAFVLWDARNQLLFAGRDRFGIKPLFYAEQGKGIALASEVKALLALGVPARWDMETFLQSTLAAATSPDRSLFDGIKQIPPGHYMVVTAKHRQVVPYWDFDYPRADAPRDPRPEAEQFQAFGETLDEAIRLRLDADVPVGCYLSGGLDSCAVLGLAARHAKQPLHAFTLSFDQAEYDELPFAEEMARMAGAQLHRVDVRAAQLADDYEDAIWHAEMPFRNAHGIAKYQLSRAARDAGFKVVLTGEGSDEILAGYPHYRRDMILHNRQGQDPRLMKLLLNDLQQSNALSMGVMLAASAPPPLKAMENVLGFVPTWIETFAAAGVHLRGLLAEGPLLELAQRDVFALTLDAIDVRNQLEGRERVHQSMYLWSKLSLPSYILTVLGDRMEMAHSIEGRVPFLDHKVVEAACRMPVSAKLRGTVEKFVLREVAHKVIPQQVYWRQKFPFMAPPNATTPGNAMHQLTQDVLRSKALEDLPLYDARKVRALLDQSGDLPPAAKIPIDGLILALTGMVMMHRRFKMGDARGALV